jgi:hypothetical protein
VKEKGNFIREMEHSFIRSACKTHGAEKIHCPNGISERRETGPGTWSKICAAEPRGCFPGSLKKVLF